MVKFYDAFRKIGNQIRPDKSTATCRQQAGGRAISGSGLAAAKLVPPISPALNSSRDAPLRRWYALGTAFSSESHHPYMSHVA